MRILLLSPVNPFSKDSGGKIRIYNVNKSIIEAFPNAYIEFIYLDDSGVEPDVFFKERIVCTAVKCERSKISALLRSMFFIKSYRFAKFSCSLPDVEGEYDLLYCHFFDMFGNIPKNVLAKRFFVDVHNDDCNWYESFMKSGNFLKRFFGWFWSRNFKLEISRIKSEITDVVCVSEGDKESISLYLRDVRYHVFGNGVDVSQVRVSLLPFHENPVAIFCGSLSVEMNKEAVTWFVQNCVCEIRKKIPDFKLLIVGRNPDMFIRNIASADGVELHENVPSVWEYYSKSSLAIMPFKHGGGSKLKLFESLLLGVPVLASAEGMVGADELNEFVYIENRTPHDFINRVFLMYESLGLLDMDEISNNIANDYSWAGLFSKSGILGSMYEK